MLLEFHFTFYSVAFCPLRRLFIPLSPFLFTFSCSSLKTCIYSLNIQMMSFHCFMTITALSPLQNVVRLVNFFANFNTTNIFIYLPFLRHLSLQLFETFISNSLHLPYKVYEYANSHGSLNIFRFLELRDISCKYTAAMVFFIFIERNDRSISFTANTGATASDRSRGNRRRENRSRMSVGVDTRYTKFGKWSSRTAASSTDERTGYENDPVLESTGISICVSSFADLRLDIVSLYRYPISTYFKVFRSICYWMMGHKILLQLIVFLKK